MPGSHRNRLKSIWPKAMREKIDQDQPQQSWSDLATNWEQDLEHRMGNHPKLTLAVAAAVGFVIGWMVKRK